MISKETVRFKFNSEYARHVVPWAIKIGWPNEPVSHKHSIGDYKILKFMISQETKDQIGKEATEYSRRVKQESGIYTFKDCYVNVATKYAEKLEEKDKIIESKDREIELLTKDIKDQGDYLKAMININVLNDAFNSGEEWRKGHKVKEGEQFTDYFMRVFNVEKEDRDHELAQLKEEIIRLDKEIDMYRDALELDQLNRVDRAGFPKPFGL